ncbi:hypothetical protein [Sphingobium sp. RSMS]|uniref:hypothetical protein n=1 Tax=Sphingobium sp. RSMS TaxID=520734 RepID=UPI0010F86E38|nr:hypothetical protein [Sphingobium sp. RSMS]
MTKCTICLSRLFLIAILPPVNDFPLLTALSADLATHQTVNRHPAYFSSFSITVTDGKDM